MCSVKVKIKRNLNYLNTHARLLRTNVNEQKLVIEQCHGLPLTSKSNHMELRVAVAKDFCGKMIKKKLGNTKHPRRLVPRSRDRWVGRGFKADMEGLGEGLVLKLSGGVRWCFQFIVITFSQQLHVLNIYYVHNI